jgi:adenylylsulfate reductase subunit A
LESKIITTDFLIIGGGTAGCYAALTFCEHSDKKVLIVEKAGIKRSGCLAAGVNAINAYISAGHSPQDYVDYAVRDAGGIARRDLLLSMSEGLNRTVRKLEALGLTILKDENGGYVTRGWRNIKINGERIKPILAEAVKNQSQIGILERVNVFEYIVKDNQILGALAVSIDEPIFYTIYAKTVLCATGGASGLYKPNNPGFSRHKMWYPPFNTGAGYAMGIRAGAEMTSFEMRFVALRCKDTIAPTGTLAQGVGAKQINAKGEVYESKYGVTTSQRIYGTVRENADGNGPCYLKTTGITPAQDEELKKAYLNMCPSQTLKWIENGKNPSDENVEIEGTEPYIVGGHTASGYWIGNDRQTTISGLFAAGDVAGGCPQKYVTGAFAEGELAAIAAAEHIGQARAVPVDQMGIANTKRWLEGFLGRSQSDIITDTLEDEMQSAMDRYAGGISQNYSCDEECLQTALQKISGIERKLPLLSANNMRELLYILELRERLTLCKSVIAHLSVRKETRWHIFAERRDYPDKRKEFECFINSRLVGGELEVIKRELI